MENKGDLRFVKIVRDRIPDLMGSSDVVYQDVSLPLYIRELSKKLIEEALEYVADPDLSELADVLAVVDALARHNHGLQLVDVMERAAQKAEKRGGFEEAWGMYVHVIPDGEG